MIVDLHTRIWDSLDSLGPAVAEQARRRRPEPWERGTASFDAHETAMAPVSCGVVHGLHAAALEARIPHQAVADAVAKSPHTLLGFAGLDPSASSDSLAELDEAVSLGMVGVNISPAAAGFHPCATEAMALYEACERRGLPIYVEAGSRLGRAAKMEFAQPFMLDEIARSFPELKLIVGGFGDPWPYQTVALLAKHPSVFCDVSGMARRPWQLYNALVAACQAEVINQVLFASNFPFGHPEKAIVTLYSVNTLSQGTPLPGIPREQLRGIVERDALALLGLANPAKEGEQDPKSSSAFEKVVIEGAAS
ncbi:MAG: amidohydrolase family protein [Planctomycetota bacterium]